jgi:hypothetical protein
MATIEKIGKVKKVTKAVAKPVQNIAAEEQLKRVGPNKEQFDKLMVEKQQKIPTEEKIEPSRTKTPIEELRALNSAQAKPTRVTPVELIAQTQEAINKMEEIKGTLKTPDAKVKDSLTPLLENKLTHVEENIQAAMSRTGSEYAPKVATAATGNPMMRFLGLLTDGQYKLQTLAMDIERMNTEKKGDLNPGMMLLLQIKVGMITQELEFFSSLLNKALESTKTIMNVQV